MEVELNIEYVCDDGFPAISREESILPCNKIDEGNTGATHYILLNRGYYWKDGPMAGLYVDGRAIHRPFKRRGEDIIFPEPSIRQLSLFD